MRNGINIISSKIFSTLNLNQFVWIYDLVAIVKSLLRDLFDLIGSLKEFYHPTGYNCDPPALAVSGGHKVFSRQF